MMLFVFKKRTIIHMYNVVIHNLNIFIFVANVLQNDNNVYKQCTDLVYISLGKKCVKEISVGFESVITFFF